MRRRRPQEDATSLDLLLDAMSNTFGGVLFLAVLLAVLMQFTTGTLATPSDASDRSAAPSFSRELQQLQEVNDRLTVALEQARESARRFGGSDVARVLELQSRADVLTMRRSDLLSARKLASDQIAAARKRIDQISSQGEELKRRLDEIEERLQEQRRRRTTTAQLPSLRSTNKREFPVVVRFGRLYTPYDTGPGVAVRRRSLDDFLVLGDRDGALAVTPKPYAGVVLDGTPQIVDQIRAELADVDTGRFYVALAVWEDSFADFAAVREVLVEEEYQYRIVPVREGGFVVEGASDAPMVQ